MSDIDQTLQLFATKESSTFEEYLGQFVSTFSGMETALKMLLVAVTGVSQPVAKAIFSGTKSDQASSFIRRCYEARKRPMPKGLPETLSHVAILTNLRNDLLHYGATEEDGEIVTTNVKGVLHDKNARAAVLEPLIFLSASVDCLLISSALIRLASRIKKPSLGPAEDEQLTIAWHYKPRAPSNKNRRRRKPKPRPKRTPRQKSSPE